MADWDELRFVKRAAEHGSFTAAAGSLGVNAATVLRRINALEERLGSRLFYRSRAGLDLTQAGQRVLT
ncbi:MAG: LysR family transcriptional regulator, partial [Mesorhizobium sp.]